MPELPEVEVVCTGIAEFVTGRTIAKVTCLHPRPVRWHPDGIAGFQAELVGRKICAPKRRGKYLWLPFDDDDALLVHLGMSGQFRINQPADEMAPNTRVLIDFADADYQLRFVDQRMFGGLQISYGGAQLPSQIAHIARDLFDPEFDFAQVSAKIMAKKSTIKRQLLDQSVVSGIGNIYADESLWLAKTNFEQPCNQLTKPWVESILRAAKQVMAKSLSQGGTSFDALYVNVNGESGYFSRSLEVYGRQDQPCSRCGYLIQRAAFMNRSAYFCPHCQPLRARAPKISLSER